MTKFWQIFISMTITSMTKNCENFQVWQKKVWLNKMAFLGYDYYFSKKIWKSMTKKKPMSTSKLVCDLLLRGCEPFEFFRIQVRFLEISSIIY